jgi:hypothetical protein
MAFLGSSLAKMHFADSVSSRFIFCRLDLLEFRRVEPVRDRVDCNATSRLMYVSGNLLAFATAMDSRVGGHSGDPLQ